MAPRSKGRCGGGRATLRSKWIDLAPSHTRARSRADTLHKASATSGTCAHTLPAAARQTENWPWHAATHSGLRHHRKNCHTDHANGPSQRMHRQRTIVDAVLQVAVP